MSYNASLAGQLLHKREEGSGVMPIRELYLLQPGVQPNQAAQCVWNSGHSGGCTEPKLYWLCQLTRQILRINGDTCSILESLAR